MVQDGLEPALSVLFVRAIVLHRPARAHLDFFIYLLQAAPSTSSQSTAPSPSGTRCGGTKNSRHSKTSTHIIAFSLARTYACVHYRSACRAAQDNNTYNIPVSVMLLNDYPRIGPVCKVDPSAVGLCTAPPDRPPQPVHLWSTLSSAYHAESLRDQSVSHTGHGARSEPPARGCKRLRRQSPVYSGVVVPLALSAGAGARARGGRALRCA